jgi:hypothetical protein
MGWMERCDRQLKYLSKLRSTGVLSVIVQLIYAVVFVLCVSYAVELLVNLESILRTHHERGAK